MKFFILYPNLPCFFVFWKDAEVNYKIVEPLDYFPAYPCSYWVYSSGDTLKVNDKYESSDVKEIDEEAKKFPIVTKTETGVTLKTVMSNSFGFGGTNAALIFEKV